MVEWKHFEREEKFYGLHRLEKGEKVKGGWVNGDWGWFTSFLPAFVISLAKLWLSKKDLFSLYSRDLFLANIACFVIFQITI